jgi:hypothetical protein
MFRYLSRSYVIVKPWSGPVYSDSRRCGSDQSASKKTAQAEEHISGFGDHRLEGFLLTGSEVYRFK